MPEDEFYMNLAEGDPVDVLVEADVGNAREPVAWQTRSFPNVVTWVPGHLPDMWSLDVMKESLQAICNLAIETEKH